jgi:hypothetical protein
VRLCSIIYRTFREPCPFSVIARSIEIYVVDVLVRRRFVDWLFVVVDVVVLIPDGRRSGRKDGLAPGILNVGGWIST